MAEDRYMPRRGRRRETAKRENKVPVAVRVVIVLLVISFLAYMVWCVCTHIIWAKCPTCGLEETECSCLAYPEEVVSSLRTRIIELEEEKTLLGNKILALEASLDELSNQQPQEGECLCCCDSGCCSLYCLTSGCSCSEEQPATKPTATVAPTAVPTVKPAKPTATVAPTAVPTVKPAKPTATVAPTAVPTVKPAKPTATVAPTAVPTATPKSTKLAEGSGSAKGEIVAPKPTMCPHKDTKVKTESNSTKVGTADGCYRYEIITVEICKDCGDEIKRQEDVSITEHDFTDGVCSKCGYKKLAEGGDKADGTIDGQKPSTEESVKVNDTGTSNELSKGQGSASGTIEDYNEEEYNADDVGTPT